MRFLADENIPAALVARLSALGHEVSWVRATAPGIPDTEVLAWAIQQSSICLTFDKDFGELATGQSYAPEFGLVLLRVPMRSPKDAERLANVIHDRQDWVGHFSVVEPGRTRMRPLTPDRPRRN